MSRLSVVINFYKRWNGGALARRIFIDPDCYLVSLPKRTARKMVSIRIRAGALSEQKERAGVGHVLEHYMAELMDETLPKGVALSAKTNDYDIVFTLSSENTQALADASAAAFALCAQPDFTRQDLFEKEKRLIINELEAEKDDADLTFERMIEKARYADEPNRRSFVDHIRTIEHLSLRDVADFHANAFTHENIKIFVAGARRNGALCTRLRNVLATTRFPSGKAHFPQPTYSSVSIATEVMPTFSGNYAAFTFLSPGRVSGLKARMTLAVLVAVMRGNENQRFLKELRAAGVYYFRVVHRQGLYNGYVALESYLDKTQISSWLDTIAGYISEIKATGPDAASLAKAKNECRRNTIERWQDNQGRLELISDFILDGENIPSMDEVERMIAGVTTMDVQALARTVFDAHYRNFVLWGKDAEHAREAYAAIDRL